MPDVPPDLDRAGVVYDESLRVPMRWWAVATMFLASMLLAFLVALPAGVSFLLAGVLTAVTVAVFLGYGSAHIVVAGGTLQAGRARIPVRLLAEPVALDAHRTRQVAGTEADARAFLLLRPYVSRSVQVRVADPADPAPYWLLSTRHPRTLAGVLEEAIVSCRGHGAD
ncbi:MAG TPA: DUF3093 domain-containing protein [Marmoricola sp.]|nr:DUF3093 domain-containing protein [Marmoricola sp.]